MKIESTFQRWKVLSDNGKRFPKMERLFQMLGATMRRLSEEIIKEFLCNLLFYQHEIIFGTHLAIQS